MRIRVRQTVWFIAITVAITIVIGHVRPSQAGEPPRHEARSKTTVVVAVRPHLDVRAILSNAEVAPGARISIAFEISPKAKVHVYAPGGKYRPLIVRLEPQPLIQVDDLVYPEPEDYFLEPLNEHAQAYGDPFRLTLHMTVVAPSDQSPPPRLTIKGTLEYQACDDKFCYLPESIDFEWAVKIRR